MNYKVTYTGNSSRFKNREFEVTAINKREAVEDVYAEYCDQNYFPDPDNEGIIRDCDGHIIATADDEQIEYDGGYFIAEELSPVSPA